MRGLLVALAAAAAVLVPAAPATTITAETPDHHAPGGAPAPLLPDPRDGDRPDEGCTVPIGESLPGCPGLPARPPVACVLPVDAPPGVLVPDCPRPDPSPESRVVPVVPLSR